MSSFGTGCQVSSGVIILEMSKKYIYTYIFQKVNMALEDMVEW